MDDSQGNCQTQAHSTGAAVARLLDAVVGKENTLQQLVRDARPLVTDHHDKCLLLTQQLELWWRRILDRVFHEIVEGALQGERTALVQRVRGPDILDLDFLVGVVIRNGHEDVRQIEGCVRLGHGVVTEEGEGAVDHRLHLVHVAKEARLLFGVFDELAAQPHPGQRSAQVVRDGGEHHGPIGHEFLDLSLHFVEGPDDLAQFPGTRFRDGRCARVDAELTHRRGESLDRAGELPGGDHRDQADRGGQEKQPYRPADGL